MIIHIRAFFNWLDKFLGGRKKTPAKDKFFESKTPSLLTGEVSTATQDSF